MDGNWEDHSRELMMEDLEETEQRLRANKLARLQEMNENESPPKQSYGVLDNTRQEKEREVSEKREETRRLIERIVQATVAATRKKQRTRKRRAKR